MEQVKLGHSLRVEIEKLDGGYISNITGKRRIYKGAHDIDDAINFKHMIGNVEEGEYMLSVDLVPKEEYVAVVKGEELITSNPIQTIEGSNLSIYERAKLDGVIQPAEKFDPEPHKPVIDVTKPISVTPGSCYTISQLQSIPWAKHDKEFPLSYREKSELTGIVDSTMYNVWNKIIAGTFQWQSANTRIGMTILAHYYEMRAEKKQKVEGIPPRNDKRLMEIVREIELLCKGGMVKSNVLLKKTEQFKKLLIQD